VHGDFREQLAEIVLLVDRELPIAQPAEKSAKDGLHDIVGIDTGRQPMADPLPGDRSQAIDIAIEEPSSRVLIAGPPAFHQDLIRNELRHGRLRSFGLFGSSSLLH
jgi:hypothetical protein